MIYVRFTPESGHSYGLGSMSAFDPKRTFIGLRGSAGVGRKPLVSVHISHQKWREILLPPKSNSLRYTPLNPGVGFGAFAPALGTKEASGTNKRAVVFNNVTNSEIDRSRCDRLRQVVSHSQIPGGAHVTLLCVGGADNHWNKWVVALLVLS